VEQQCAIATRRPARRRRPVPKTVAAMHLIVDDGRPQGHYIELTDMKGQCANTTRGPAIAMMALLPQHPCDGISQFFAANAQ